MKNQNLMNDIIPRKIRLVSNRLRCPKCYSDKFAYVVGNSVQYKFRIEVNAEYFPVFKARTGKMSIGKLYELVPDHYLSMVCMCCRHTRNMGISMGYLGISV